MSLVATPVAQRAALRFGILDQPGGHKSHALAIPYLGGVAIAVAFSVAITVAAVLRPPAGGLSELLGIVGLALFMSVVGLVDDLRGLSVKIRFAFQLLAATLLWVVGVRIQLSGVEGLDMALTVAWTVGIMNSFNLLDNMDGLSAGVATVASFSLFVVAAVNGQFLVAALGLALAGCAAGFLKHNVHPARIFMGDSGSLFLGFLLAALGVKLRFPGPVAVTFFVPILILGVAILDTCLVVTTRVLNGRSPFAGGRDHLSHRLVFVGLPVPIAVGTIYAAAIAHGWLAVVMSRVDRSTGFLLMSFVLVLDVSLGVLLGRVPVYENSRRRRFMLREVETREAEVVEPVHHSELEGAVESGKGS